MIFKRNALVVATLLCSISALAASDVKEFSVPESNQKFKSIVPAGWDAITGLLGSPLSLISKKGQQGTASVIEVVPYGRKDTNDLFKKMQKDPESFYSLKEDEVDAAEGEMISYLPFEEIKKDGATIYSIGVKYKDDGGEYLDQTFYVSTKGKELFFVKALVPLDLENDHATIVSQVVDSVSAKN
jgi:hypothetical protein